MANAHFAIQDFMLALEDNATLALSLAKIAKIQPIASPAIQASPRIMDNAKPALIIASNVLKQTFAQIVQLPISF